MLTIEGKRITPGEENVKLKQIIPDFDRIRSWRSLPVVGIPIFIGLTQEIEWFYGALVAVIPESCDELGTIPVNDRLAYGMKITSETDGLTIHGQQFKRAEPRKRTRSRTIGKVSSANTDGTMTSSTFWGETVNSTSLIEWYEYEPLGQISRDMFRYPNRGLYDKEDLVFRHDADGRAVEVKVGGVVFKRRDHRPSVPD